MKPSLRKNGFTIVELLVVVAIAAMLILIALPAACGKTQHQQFVEYVETHDIRIVEVNKKYNYTAQDLWVENGVYVWHRHNQEAVNIAIEQGKIGKRTNKETNE